MSQKEKTFNKLEYDNKFIKENYIQFAFRLRKSSDAEAIEKIKSVPNKSDYLRQLILKDDADFLRLTFLLWNDRFDEFCEKYPR